MASVSGGKLVFYLQLWLNAPKDLEQTGRCQTVVPDVPPPEMSLVESKPARTDNLLSSDTLNLIVRPQTKHAQFNFCENSISQAIKNNS